ADRREVPGGSDGAARAAEAEARRGRARLSAVRVREDSGPASDDDAAAEAAMKSAAALVAAALAVASLASAGVQVPKAADNNITPVYEGWLPNADGSFDLVFGYLNRDWDDEVSIPLVPDNTIDPGGPDRGQPTYFFPRRNRFVFNVRVPKDFGTKEIAWSLTTKGRTEKAYGTLKNDYVLNDTVIMSNIGAGGALSTTPDMVGNKA